MLKRLSLGFLLSLAMSATLAAAKDPTNQILVVIQCRCLTRYYQWMCEMFWWALC